MERCRAFAAAVGLHKNKCTKKSSLPRDGLDFFQTLRKTSDARHTRLGALHLAPPKFTEFQEARQGLNVDHSKAVPLLPLAPLAVAYLGLLHVIGSLAFIDAGAAADSTSSFNEIRLRFVSHKQSCPI